MAKSKEQEEVTVVQPIGVPAGVEVKKITLQEFAGKLTALAGVAEVLAAHGIAPEDAAIQGYGAASVLAIPASGEVPANEIYITAGNKTFILAALSRLPQYRAKFAELVMAKVAEGRGSPEYISLLQNVEAAEGALKEAIAACRMATAEYAKPFDSSLFIESDIREVKRLGAVGSGSKPGERQRAPTETHWTLERYSMPRLIDGTQYFLIRSGREWQVVDEAGSVYASGDSANAATREWMVLRGRGVNVSAPALWGAAAQEAAAAE